MKILVTCDSMITAASFEEESKNFRDEFTEVHYLIKSNKLFFILRLIKLLSKVFVRNSGFEISAFKGICSIIQARRFKLTNNLEDPYIMNYLKDMKFDTGFHAMGVIYPKPFLNSFKYGVLNSHIGKLPEMRGRSVFEWSLIYNIPTGITCFIMDSGIDTGPKIISFKPVIFKNQINVFDSKNSLFAMDKKTYFEALTNLKSESFKKNRTELGKRYYKMSGLLLKSLEKSLSDASD